MFCLARRLDGEKRLELLRIGRTITVLNEDVPTPQQRGSYVNPCAVYVNRSRAPEEGTTAQVGQTVLLSSSSSIINDGAGLFETSTLLVATFCRSPYAMCTHVPIVMCPLPPRTDDWPIGLNISIIIIVIISAVAFRSFVQLFGCFSRFF